MTAIGATAGASSAAIMGGNIGLGAAAGAAAGFIGGAVGGRLADSWAAGIARTAAGIGTAAAAGAASAAVAGGNAGEGALLGFTGAVTYALASAIANGDFQRASDTGQKANGALGKAAAAAKATETATGTSALKQSSNGSIDWTGHDQLLAKAGIYFEVERVEGTGYINGVEYRFSFPQPNITNMSPDMKFTIAPSFQVERTGSIEVFGVKLEGRATFHIRAGFAVHKDE